MKILEITTLYPKGNNKVRATEFLHEYNKELVKDGKNEVHVIFLSRKYPALFKYVKKVASCIPGLREKVIPYSDQTHEKSDEVYYQDSIKVQELTIEKYIPHGEFPAFEIRRVKKVIRQCLEAEGFRPDVVILDFLSPCAQMWDLFPDSKVFLVPHYTDLSYVKKNKLYEQISRNVAAVMYRSPTQRRLFEEAGIVGKDAFNILSGVPEHVIEESAPRNQIRKFMTACRLIREKNVLMVIRALEQCNCPNWEYTVVGAGEMQEEISQYIQDHGLQDRCHLLGWKEKADVYSLMRQSDCFIMPSLNETFGMVYIEAMSKGCVALGSKGEGIDGVIVDGVNGLLVDPRDEDGLVDILNSVMTMGPEQVVALSKNGIATAQKLTNENLAHSLEEFLQKYI